MLSSALILILRVCVLEDYSRALNGKGFATPQKTMRSLGILFLSVLCMIPSSLGALAIDSQAQPVLAQSHTTPISSSLRGSVERSAEASYRALATASSNATNANATSTSDDDFITANIWDYRPYVIPVIVCGILLVLVIALCVLASCGLTPDILCQLICCPLIVCFEGCVHCMSCIDPSIVAVLCCWCFLICPDKKPKSMQQDQQVQMHNNPSMQQPGVVHLAPGAASWGSPNQSAYSQQQQQHHQQSAHQQQPQEIPIAEAVVMPDPKSQTPSTAKI